MSRRQRVESPFIFVIINIIVSGLTILTINWIWGRSHPQQLVLIPTPGICITSESTAAILLQPTLAPENIHLVIDNIYGVGKLDSEDLVIINQSEGTINLNGWKLDDGHGTVYNFPDLTLHAGGQVQLFSSAGIDTVTKLFWGQDNAVWKAGKSATLRSPIGVVYASYVIP